jgi:4-hydroxythreonine-4-phosphate dehydrogenase
LGRQQFALENYRYALELARDGRADAVCFTPFNKKAMRLARSSYDDDAFSAEVVEVEGSASEFNILDKLWNARVTSHIPLAEVPARLTKERILRALKLTDGCSVRGLRWPASIRTPATAATSAARRST